MIKVEERICTKCGDELHATLEYFYKHGNGLDTQCKICRSDYRKKYRDNHKKECEVYIRNYYKKNKKAITRNCQKYRDENKEAKKKYNHKYGIKNKKVISIQKQKYHKNNKEKINKRTKKYRDKNKDMVAANNRNRRVLKLVNGTAITSIEWANKIKEYDGKCAYCNVVLEENISNIYNPNGISEDHVIPVTKGGKHEIENLVPCCRDCNTKKSNKKGIEFDEWLKERRG